MFQDLWLPHKILSNSSFISTASDPYCTFMAAVQYNKFCFRTVHKVYLFWRVRNFVCWNFFCTAYRPGRHGPTHNLYLFRSLLGFTFKNFLSFNLSVTDVFINKKSHPIQGCSENISWKEKLHFLQINSAEFFFKGNKPEANKWFLTLIK